MARVQSVGFQVSQIIKAHNGVGISKKEQRNESGITSVENGHKVSDKFHSYKSLDNARNDLTNLGKFAKSELGIKDMSKIDINTIKAWISSKNITYNTASNYFSELNKVHEHMNFTRQEIKELRAELKETLAENIKESRYYKELEKVVVNNRSQPAFELQRDYGLREKEATYINLDKQLNNNILTIQGKGGKIIEKEINPSLISKLKENAVNGIYRVPTRTYEKDLQKAITSQANNKWNGTHGIRHTYAQNLLEKGYSKLEVSKEMGHSREEITNVYLR